MARAEKALRCGSRGASPLSFLIAPNANKREQPWRGNKVDEAAENASWVRGRNRRVVNIGRVIKCDEVMDQGSSGMVVKNFAAFVPVKAES